MARRKKKNRIQVWNEQIQDKFNEELKVWHLLVSLCFIVWTMNAQFLSVMREVADIREEVESQQAAQTEMIMNGLELLGVPIKDIIKEANDR